MFISGAWGKRIHEKNMEKKISWYCPFKKLIWFVYDVTDRAASDAATEGDDDDEAAEADEEDAGQQVVAAHQQRRHVVGSIVHDVALRI